MTSQKCSSLSSEQALQLMEKKVRMAVYSNDAKKLRCLLGKHNEKMRKIIIDNSYDYLISAFQRGHTQILKILLENGANLGASNSKYFSPAIFFGVSKVKDHSSKTILELIIRYGQHEFETLKRPKEFGKTPMELLERESPYYYGLMQADRMLAKAKEQRRRRSSSEKKVISDSPPKTASALSL